MAILADGLGFSVQIDVGPSRVDQQITRGRYLSRRRIMPGTEKRHLGQAGHQQPVARMAWVSPLAQGFAETRQHGLVDRIGHDLPIEKVIESKEIQARMA